MTTQAQNALLLTLEEPPQYAVFLLLTTDSSMLLETVRSRAINLRTELFSAEYVYEYLKGIPGFSSKGDAKLKTAASVSGGALGVAKEVLVGENKSAVISQNASKFIENLVGGKASENILFISAMKYSRQEYIDFFGFCEAAIRDLIAYKNGNANFTFYSDTDEVSGLCRAVPLSALVKMYEASSKAKDDITSANANITLVLTHLAASAV